MREEIIQLVQLEAANSNNQDRLPLTKEQDSLLLKSCIKAAAFIPYLLGHQR
ncbi:hypothetical protein QJS04_geneDACA021818 [Acorus gramineus]|uniref:Uncharacterized protein n=1 Tax=Acorus gramineus TaxID=55184 RepID=A0AAV8ZZD1_ACOGR|nr:hypothetical protein QJS04_geneDACA021818 [Acorus gramineus]